MGFLCLFYSLMRRPIQTGRGSRSTTSLQVVGKKLKPFFEFKFYKFKLVDWGGSSSEKFNPLAEWQCRLWTSLPNCSCGVLLLKWAPAFICAKVQLQKETPKCNSVARCKQITARAGSWGWGSRAQAKNCWHPPSYLQAW